MRWCPVHSRLIFSASPPDVVDGRSSTIISCNSRVTAQRLKKQGIPPANRKDKSASTLPESSLTRYFPVLFPLPKCWVGCGKAISPIFRGVSTQLAFQLIAQCRFLTVHPVHLTVASCGPSIPMDIVRIALWASSKVRIVDGMYDVQWLKVRRSWQDVWRCTTLLGMQIRRRQEPRTEKGHFFSQNGQRLSILRTAPNSGRFMDVVDILDNVCGPVELLGVVRLRCAKLFPAFNPLPYLGC